MLTYRITVVAVASVTVALLYAAEIKVSMRAARQRLGGFSLRRPKAVVFSFEAERIKRVGKALGGDGDAA